MNFKQREEVGYICNLPQNKQGLKQREVDKGKTAIDYISDKGFLHKCIKTQLPSAPRLFVRWQNITDYTCNNHQK